MATKHQRQVIREAIVAQLTGKTYAEERVLQTREYPLRRVELPALQVYVVDESVDQDSKSTAPRYLSRILKVAIVATLELDDDLESKLDAIALQIERAIDADWTFGAVAGDAILTDTQLGVDEEAKRPVGMVSLTYSVTYETPCPDATDLPALGNFATADVKTNLGGSQPAGDQAEDRVTVPTT